MKKAICALGLVGVIVLSALAVDSISRSIAASPAQVVVAPTDDLQALVLANDPGTTFVLQPGIHRNGVTSLKDNDSFVGEPGAVLNGSKLLSEWELVTIDGRTYWTTAGGTPLSTPTCPAWSGKC